MADKGAKGYLDKENFFTALKLIACVQQGRELAISNLTMDIPAPVIASQAESPSLPAFGSSSQAEMSDWIIKSKDQAKYDEIFHTLGPLNGKLSGEQVRPVLLNSGLPNEILGRIWELSDIDKDGYLDRDEMCVALHLVYRALESDPVPVALPHNMLPPSKRRPSVAGSQHYSSSRKSSALSGAIR
uniref:Uncharacterized protein n=1 Tax=Romanomermis culicivorax TaxID=13658 RepID=A0A915IVP3_ROMCU